MLLPMTEKQSKIFQALVNFISDKEYPPTISEIQNILQISNPGAVHKSLKALESKGYIEKTKRKHRGIKLTDVAERKFLQ